MKIGIKITTYPHFFLVNRSYNLPKLQAYKNRDNAVAALEIKKKVLRVNNTGIGISFKDANISNIAPKNAQIITIKYNLLLTPIICFFKKIDEIRKTSIIKAAISKYRLNPMCARLYINNIYDIRVISIINLLKNCEFLK